MEENPMWLNKETQVIPIIVIIISIICVICTIKAIITYINDYNDNFVNKEIIIALICFILIIVLNLIA